MFLKRLEVYGFKSFAEKLDLSFSNGITAIVGPNGSGKSNVSDAVRWVLGEQSAKQLRGANMADVIFKGTDKRKPLSYCEVSLVFDNTDKGLDIEYSEVVITRRLYRSGESEYYINRNGCRLKDIVTLFQDTGIGKEGYSIVGQGKIENILSVKQEERRSVFEEAAGIVKYKTRKAESERKLEHTSENLVRINDIIDTLEERVEPLAQQAETARAYLGLRENLRSIEVNYYLVQNELAEQKRKQYNDLLEDIDREKKEKTRLVEKIVSENALTEEKLREKEEVLQQIRDSKLETTAESENVLGQKRVLEERILNASEQLERVKKEAENTAERRQSLSDAMNGDSSAEERKLADISAKKAEIEALENDVRSRDALLEEENAQLEKLKAEMMDNINRLSDVKSNISHLNTMRINIEGRREKILVAKEQIRLQKNAVSEALKEQSDETEKFNGEKKALNEKLQLSLAREEKFKKRNSEISELLRSAQSDINASLSKLKVLQDLKRDFEGYNYSVKKLLSQKDINVQKHICGVIAQLISVPEKYEVAIESALGSAMQNIVTPTEEDAKFLIDFLRKNDFGRATFLPVSVIKGRTAEERDKLNVQGCFGIASDLVSFDPKYGEIVRNLLGRTVICDNLDTGITIAGKTGHSLRIVTLKGDVMNAGGSMSGGSLKQKTSSLLGREREIETLKKLAESKRNEAEGLKCELADISTGIAKCSEETEKIKREIHGLEIKYARDFEKTNALKNDYETAENSEKELSLEDEQLLDTLAEIEEEFKGINALQGNFESDNSDAQEQIALRKSEYNKKYLEREKTAQKLTDARIECAGLEKELEAMRTNAKRMEELIENLKNTEQKLALDSKNYAEMLENAQKEKQENEVKSENCTVKLNEITKKERLAEEEKDKLGFAVKENEEKRRRLEAEIYDAGERRHKTELALAKSENDLSYLENRMWDEYELTKGAAEELRDPEFRVSGAQGEINKLKKSISALGNVNVNAIEEYAETKEKYETLSSQRNDLEKAKSDLENIIDELTKKMDKQFREQFAVINKYFTETFSELFGGGRAELKLENGENSLDADIEIVAQPPGKSLQMLTLLSGGERALTAIAILFAMLKLKPTPFCILDEIEAALDEANVGNFASYLRKFSGETQFIVITHRKPTMEEADSLYGVAMEEKGVSKVVSVKLT